ASAAASSAVATTTTASAAVASAATTAAAVAAATTARSARAGLVHGPAATIVVATVQGLDRGICLGVAGHLDAAEAAAPAHLAIVEHVCGADGPVLLEQLL